MSGLMEYYDYYFKDLADKRVESWYLMSNPFPMMGLVIAYLYIVLKAGPEFMKHRPAFNLKEISQIYNVAQLLACIYVTYGLLVNGWTDDMAIFKCSQVDYSMDKKAVNLLKICYFVFWMKIFEFLETFIFILRKKQNQVSTLHVYHHASTMMFGWLIVKYIGGGMVTFLHLINTVVHILMYAYYLLSTLGTQWRKSIAPYKPMLTLIQMIQFCLMIAHIAVGLTPNCNFSPVLTFPMIPNILINFYMFANFFKNSYVSVTKKN